MRAGDGHGHRGPHVDPEERKGFVVGSSCDPPPRSGEGRRPTVRPTPKLNDRDRVLFVLIVNAPHWYCVEFVDQPVSKTSALSNALRRKGCDVTLRSDTKGGHWVFARWTHETPVI